MRRAIGRLAPWVVTLAFLGFLFWRTPFGEVVDAVGRAKSWMLPAMLVSLTAIYLTDSLAIWKTFGWFVAPLRFGQVLAVRGAAYLLAVINYSLGQGAIVYFVHRATGVPVLRGIGTVLLIMGTNLLVLLGLTTAGLAVAPAMPGKLILIVKVAYAGLAAYAVAVALRPRWLAGRPVFDVLMSAGLAGHLKAMLVRLPHIASLLVFNFAVLHAFGVDVPVTHAVATLPVVFFISVLPISVQGLGTTQMAMIFFFAHYVPAADAHTREATVFAASGAMTVMGFVFQMIVGLACLRTSAARSIRRVDESPPPAVPVAEPSK